MITHFIINSTNRVVNLDIIGLFIDLRERTLLFLILPVEDLLDLDIGYTSDLLKISRMSSNCSYVEIVLSKLD